jgi:2-methylisocitrate lyase-like PEP mutase family enzyme
MGVRRISVGGALARTAWAGFLRAAREIAEQGTFTDLAARSLSRGGGVGVEALAAE